MNLSFLSAILAQVTSTPSGTNAAAAAGNNMQDDPRASMLKNLLLMGMVFVLIYLFLFRPQSKQRKQQEAMLKTVKPGDKVVTTSGIVGTVVALKDKTLSLRSADTKLEVLKSTVTEITERGGDSGSGQ